MPLPASRKDREQQKFVDDGSGNVAIRVVDVGGGFTNPMPLDTFLQGTRSDAQVVNLIGVTDDFGGNIVAIGDITNNTNLILAKSDMATQNVFLQFGNLVSVQAVQDITNSLDLYYTLDLTAVAYKWKHETPNAAPAGIIYSYEMQSDLPANSDVLHTFNYLGVSDALNAVVYAATETVANSIADGVEIGQYTIKVRDAGGLYGPLVFTGAKRIDIALTAGATSYTALYNEASLSETFTDNSNNLTILTQDTARWNVSAQDIGLGYFGSAEVNADSILLSLDDGVGVEPKLSLDFNTPYFGLGSPFDFGMTIDIANNLINFDGNVIFNDELTTGASSLLGFFGASATGQLGPIADATGAGDVVAQLNALLAVCRTYGFIAT